MPERKKGLKTRRRSAGGNGDQPTVKSIARATMVLGRLGEGVNALTEIAGDCRLSKSTVHRLLRALEESGLVMQDQANHRYYLGPLITRLTSNPATTHEYLITCSIGEMARLSSIIGETVNICVMPALQDIIVYEIPSKYDLKVTEENRKLGTLYAGSAMMSLLSQFSDEQLKTVMKNITIEPYTERTITNKALFLKKIKQVRRQGFAISYGEKIPGATGISAPVPGYIHPAALNVVGPDMRIKPGVDFFVKEVVASARRITANVADIYKK